MPLDPTPRWHIEVPGTRWFRVDLHLHTLDDYAGGRIAVPPELAGGDPSDPALLTRYAQRVLDAAVERGVEVLGLTRIMCAPVPRRAPPGRSSRPGKTTPTAKAARTAT